MHTAAPPPGTLLSTRPLPVKAAATAAAFTEHFQRPAQWLAAAPGRVNLIGEHVDYCDGLVMPMAIDRHVILAAAASTNRIVRVFSRQTDEEVQIPLTGPIERGVPAWTNYVRGVLRGLADRGIQVPGLDVLVDSDVPMGGGLSSSAALEVGTATLLETATGCRLDPAEKALLCQRAEHDFAGVPCGIMDQFACVFGRENHLLLLDCRGGRMEPVPMRDASVTVLIINTNVRHELGNSQYPVRRAECEEGARRLGLATLREATLGQFESASVNWPDPIRRRARHVITEIARTRDAATALEHSDWSGVGDLMYASHESLRHDFEVSCVELDRVVQLARQLGRERGVFGCRMTGAGFGGCCVALVQTGRVEEIARVMGERYATETGIAPTLFASRPAAGAAALESPRS